MPRGLAMLEQESMVEQESLLVLESGLERESYLVSESHLVSKPLPSQEPFFSAGAFAFAGALPCPGVTARPGVAARSLISIFDCLLGSSFFARVLAAFNFGLLSVQYGQNCLLILGVSLSGMITPRVLVPQWPQFSFLSPLRLPFH
jgi:hypothetical protein